MGQTIAFDTHAYVKKLKAVGFTEEQAEVQAETLVSLIDERLATKHDIQLLRHDMKEMEITLKRDMKEMEMRLTIKLGALLATAVVLVAALVKLF